MLPRNSAQAEVASSEGYPTVTYGMNPARSAWANSSNRREIRLPVCSATFSRALNHTVRQREERKTYRALGEHIAAKLPSDGLALGRA